VVGDFIASSEEEQDRLAKLPLSRFEPREFHGPLSGGCFLVCTRAGCQPPPLVRASPAAPAASLRWLQSGFALVLPGHHEVRKHSSRN
jgi:hypothetical protein